MATPPSASPSSTTPTVYTYEDEKLPTARDGVETEDAAGDVVRVYGTVDLDRFASTVSPALPPLPSQPPPSPSLRSSFDLPPPRPHRPSYRISCHSTPSSILSSTSSPSVNPCVLITLDLRAPQHSQQRAGWRVAEPIQLEFRHLTVTLPPRAPTQSLSSRLQHWRQSIASLPQRLLSHSSPIPQQPSLSNSVEMTGPATSSLRSSLRSVEPSGGRRVLSDVSGFASPGQLLAIMGSSGSGKTTLLNVLAGRLRGRRGPGCVQGELLLNGRVASGALLSCVSAYVMQDDVLMPVMSAREHVQFSADMRLPATAQENGHAGKVSEVLAELGLTHCADVRVGAPAAGDGRGHAGGAAATSASEDHNSLLAKVKKALLGSQRGLSGGEQKRVSIAIELVTDPLLVFIDEPTSGLDSSTAFTIVSLLKRLAQRGRTVVCTIHSPSSKIFSLFDQLMLLSPTGELAYLGPAADALPHFQRLGHICPPTMSAADFFLRLLHVGSEEEQQKVTLLVQSYAEHPAVLAARVVSSSPITGRSKSSTSQPFQHQLRLLTQRAFWQYSRQPVHIIARVAENLFLTLFIGLLFLQSGHDQRSIYARIAFVFFVVCMQSLLTLVYSVLTFTEERALFTRERGCHVYRTSAYFLSKALLEVPVQVGLSFLLGSVGYFMVGLQPDASHFFRFSLGLALLALASNSLGQILGALAPSALMAVMLSPISVIPFMLTSGFFLNLDDFPPYLIPLRALSPHLYVFTSLFSLEFTDLPFHCRPDETIPIYVGPLRTDFCYLTSGQKVLDMFHICEDSRGRYWSNMGYVALLFVGFRWVAFMALKVRARQGHAGEEEEEGERGGLWVRMKRSWRGWRTRAHSG